MKKDKFVDDCKVKEEIVSDDKVSANVQGQVESEGERNDGPSHAECDEKMDRIIQAELTLPVQTEIEGLLLTLDSY